MGLSTTYTKTETDFLIQQGIATAYLGIATTTTTPPATGAYWYKVDTAGTYTNFKNSSNASIVVSAGDLTGNDVTLEVKDNVATKRVFAKTIATSTAKIESWSAKVFTQGSQVLHGGKIYEANAATVEGDVPGVSAKWVGVVNVSSVFKHATVNPSYISAVEAILSIKIYDDDQTNCEYQVTELKIDGFITVAKKDLSENVIGIVTKQAINTLRKIKDDIYEGNMYSTTLNIWVSWKVDISKIVAFSTSVTDTKLNVLKKNIFRLADINYSNIIAGLPIAETFYTVNVIKEITIFTDVDLKLRVQSITNNSITVHNENNNNASAIISKSSLQLLSSGLYSGEVVIYGGIATVRILVDFNSVNSTNQFATAVNTLLYFHKYKYAAKLNANSKSIYVDSFKFSTANAPYFAIKSVKIFTNNVTYRYTVQALRKTGQVVVIYKRDKAGVNIEQISINQADKSFINDSTTLWTYDGYGGGKDRIQIIVDDSLITDFGNTSDNGSEINPNNFYPTLIEFNFNRNYCNLGASTSSGYWHVNAVKHNKMNWRTFNVGSCMWIVKDGAVLNTGTYTSSSLDNNIFNQIAKLNIANTNEGYYPDAISVMCGLSESHDGTWVLGTYEDAMSADLSGYTAENWIATAPQNYKNNMAICVRAALTFLAKKYIYSQIITYTVQQIDSPSYAIDKVLAINELIKKISKRLAIQTIDIGGECGIDGISGTTAEFIGADFIHYSTAGDKVAYNYARKKIEQVLFFKK